MSKYQSIREIRKEISRLNQIIDRKIIHGMSYAKESHRHKQLVAQLSQLSPRESWLQKSLSFATMFMF